MAQSNGAALNVRINLPGLEDQIFRDETYDKVTDVSKKIDAIVAEVMPKLIAQL